MLTFLKNEHKILIIPVKTLLLSMKLSKLKKNMRHLQNIIKQSNLIIFLLVVCMLPTAVIANGIRTYKALDNNLLSDKILGTEGYWDLTTSTYKWIPENRGTVHTSDKKTNIILNHPLNITGSTLSLTSGNPLTAGNTSVLGFQVNANSSDDEYIPSVAITLPSGWTVTCNTDDGGLNGDGTSCSVSSTTVTYTFSGSANPGLRNNDIWNFTLNVTAPGGTTAGNYDYSYVLTGDGFGGNPHSVSNTVSGGITVNSSCINPTTIAFAMQPSCTNDMPNNDGYLQLSAVTNGDRVNFSTGSTYTGDADYGDATIIGALPFQFAMGQSNPSGSQDYTIRVFNAESACFTDVVVTMTEQDCEIGCNCIENVYLNEVSNNGKIHRYTIDMADTSFTEVLIGGNAWYPGTETSQLPAPHGITIDINGRIYAGESYSNGQIRRLNCEGEIDPESDFLLDDVSGLTNIQTLKGDIIYTNIGTAWNICTQSSLPGVTFCNDASEEWGFYIDQSTGAFYSTTNFSGPNHIYKYTETDYGSGVCIPIFINESVLYANVSGTNQGNTRARGIVTDVAGNIYVAYFTNTVSGGTTNEGLIVKYDSNGNYVSHLLDAQDDGMGWAVTSALVYSKETGILYSATQSTVEPCVYAFSTEPTFAPIGPMVDPSGDTELQGTGNFTLAKGMNIIEQCCPINNNITIDTTLCDAAINDVLFLQQLTNCSGTICEGNWQEGPSNTGITYNECDNSITINALNACGSFTIESDGMGATSQCGAFKMTVNISVGNGTASVIAGDQTICPTDDPAAFTVSTPATGNGTITYQWQSSKTSCTTGFSDIAGATSDTYDSGSVTETTYFRVISSSVGGCSTGSCADTSNCVTLTIDPGCPSCTNPTATASAMQPSCTKGAPNNDGYLQLTSVTNGDRVNFSTGNTYTGDADYANATTIGALPFQFATGQNNPSGSQEYTIRVFNGASDCFTDIVVTMNEQDCLCSGNAIAVGTASQGIDYNTADSIAVLGMADGDYAEVYDVNDRLVLELSDTIATGETYSIIWRRKSTYSAGPFADLIIEESSDGNSWTFNPVSLSTDQQTFITSNITSVVPVRFLRIRIATNSNDDVDIDAIAYSGVICDCINPTVSALAAKPTCANGTANDDGYLQLSSVSNGDRFHWSLGNSFDDNGGTNNYDNATSILSATYPIQFATGQSNPATSQDYTIRVYNCTNDCYTDVVVTMNHQDCIEGCDCTEVVYVNDVERDEVHKFSVNPMTGAFTEIGKPWLTDIKDPHGAVADLNGYIYIGEKNLGGPDNSRLIKLTCDGERLDTLFAGNFNNNDVTNFVTNGNILYSAGRDDGDVDAYELCTETNLGTISLPAGSSNWELFEGEDGLMYTIDRNQNTLSIYNVPYDTAMYGQGNTISTPTLVTDIVKSADDVFWGVDQDGFGNWYVVVRHQTGGTITGSTIYMLSTTGQTLTSINDNNDGGILNPGFFGTRGIVYSPYSDKLYLSSFYESCIAVVEIDRTSGSEQLTLNSTISAPGGGGKDISILLECCPTTNDITIDTTLCEASINDKIFLQELISCEGTICEGLWQEGGANMGLTYDNCDNSVTINSLNACGTFTLESDGTGSNPQCGAFSITVNISVGNVTASVIAGDQTICSGGNPAAFTVNTPATGTGTISYQWQSSTTSCTAGFSDIAGATSDTYDSEILSDTTYFRVISSVNGGCSTGTCADTSNCVTITVQDCDWGDLPDVTNGVALNDYQTTNANNGPVHVIIPGLSLGTTVDGETDGQPSGDALDDGLDEDGLTIFPTLDVSPGNTFRLPLDYTNTTGIDAHIEAWIDWNANGEFDVGEMVYDEVNPTDNYIEVTAPTNAISGEFLGVRIRISNEDNMSPYGRIDSGEIEDYLIGLDCKTQICLPINVTLKRK